ncbi:MAG: hypothetical protein QOG23_2819 [Blastocatellia bacterium]|jgi:hypothetical protein|nr:hypothetical protein [Blastocatellia bacterium]
MRSAPPVPKELFKVRLDLFGLWLDFGGNSRFEVSDESSILSCRSR